jgi:hypothetical protein
VVTKDVDISRGIEKEEVKHKKENKNYQTITSDAITRCKLDSSFQFDKHRSFMLKLQNFTVFFKFSMFHFFQRVQTQCSVQDMFLMHVLYYYACVF